MVLGRRNKRSLLKGLARCAPQLCYPGGRGGGQNLEQEQRPRPRKRMKTPARPNTGSVFNAHTGPSKTSEPERLPPSALSSFLPCFRVSLLLPSLAERGGDTAVKHRSASPSGGIGHAEHCSSCANSGLGLLFGAAEAKAAPLRLRKLGRREQLALPLRGPGSTCPRDPRPHYVSQASWEYLSQGSWHYLSQRS